jgi:hypothetical protein
MLPVTFCENFPDVETGASEVSGGALPVKTWLTIETLAALTPCETAQRPKMLAAKEADRYDFILTRLVILPNAWFRTSTAMHVIL